MINQIGFEDYAKSHQVSEIIIRILFKEAVLDTLKRFHGNEKVFAIDVDTMDVTSIENNSEKRVPIKEVLSRKMALACTIKFREFLDGLKPQMPNENEITSSNDEESYYEKEIDPHEDYSWGDLTGTEAYDAYWNCE